ncbi:hypothetical protein [Inquilinus limosus]|uniref:Uncharacterized protein n=1 Tax=Inquilinus limosus TaxID=171674 RepID=A0A211ZN22_9PROT|nr:hypothetical protein [Inquilinus limosus]OWJ66661.1 hypothetical protein BWR60_13500 [Inquilinus limosus]
MDDEPQFEPIRPTDPDMHWTGWALHLVRQAAEMDMRVKRMTERQQERASADSPIDCGLIHSRLSRSIRLSVALTERIRAEYLMRRGERVATGEEQQRRQKREQVTDTVTKALATPADGEGAEYLRAAVWETLVEDETLDAQMDTLSSEEFLQAVCRKLGRPPPQPQGCDTEAAIEPAETDPADRDAAEPWPESPAESAAGRPLPRPPKPDSS